MSSVRGVADVGVFRVTGQPNLIVSIDRAAAGRYGLMAADLNAAVQGAVGGIATTQILQGDRRFDFLVRYRPEYRGDPTAIRNILLATPDGSRVPLGQVAHVSITNGAFMIYRENDRRYIPIKFSIRGRDLSSTMQELESRLEKEVQLPRGYHYEWAGEYDSLQKEQRRLMIILPITLAVIFLLLYLAFNSVGDALVNPLPHHHRDAVQHLSGGWLRFVHRRCHAHRTRLPQRRSSRAAVWTFTDPRRARRCHGRDASHSHGLPCRCPGPVAGRHLARNWCASSTTPGASHCRLHDHHRVHRPRRIAGARDIHRTQTQAFCTRRRYFLIKEGEEISCGRDYV